MMDSNGSLSATFSNFMEMSSVSCLKNLDFPAHSNKVTCKNLQGVQLACYMHDKQAYKDIDRDASQHSKIRVNVQPVSDLCRIRLGKPRFPFASVGLGH